MKGFILHILNNLSFFFITTIEETLYNRNRYFMVYMIWHLTDSGRDRRLFEGENQQRPQLVKEPSRRRPRWGNSIESGRWSASRLGWPGARRLPPGWRIPWWSNPQERCWLQRRFLPNISIIDFVKLSFVFFFYLLLLLFMLWRKEVLERKRLIRKLGVPNERHFKVNQEFEGPSI